ncbi:MAG TPA: ZIP family metal transporter [Gelria sp.]|jgi:ZIP family zinc transporter|nr:ZIP family metal transporter [Gelria sp.]
MGISQVLGISIAAGACTALGAILLFVKKRWDNSSLAIFLGLASGVMVAVVLFDMLPSALIFGGWFKALVGMVLGLFILAIFDRQVFNRSEARDSLVALGYMIMLGIAMHDLPEGMAIALGSEMKARTGMVIALGIGIHNIPEGMAIAAPLLMAGIKQLRVLGQILLVGLITPLGTVIGLLAVAFLPNLLPLLLGLASGIMIYLVFFQLWPQARAKDPRSRWWGFWLGMAIILIATFI